MEKYLSNELSSTSSSLKPFYINLFIVILMLVVLIISFMASYNLYSNKFDWLQRSGSLVVAIAIYMEYRHLKIFLPNATTNSVINGSLMFSGSKYIKFAYDFVWKINYTLLIIGTLLWGYGDIPFDPNIGK